VLHSRAYSARSHLAPTALDPLHLPLHWLRRRSLIPPMTTRRVWRCHVPNLVQIRSKLWPCIRNKLTHKQTG